MCKRDSHQDRVIHAHNELRKPLLPHVPHRFVLRVECLHVHAQWHLDVFGHIKAHADIRLPVTITNGDVTLLRRELRIWREKPAQ